MVRDFAENQAWEVEPGHLKSYDYSNLCKPERHLGLLLVLRLRARDFYSALSMRTQTSERTRFLVFSVRQPEPQIA